MLFIYKCGSIQNVSKAFYLQPINSNHIIRWWDYYFFLIELRFFVHDDATNFQNFQWIRTSFGFWLERKAMIDGMIDK